MPPYLRFHASLTHIRMPRSCTVRIHPAAPARSLFAPASPITTPRNRGKNGNIPCLSVPTQLRDDGKNGNTSLLFDATLRVLCVSRSEPSEPFRRLFRGKFCTSGKNGNALRQLANARNRISGKNGNTSLLVSWSIDVVWFGGRDRAFSPGWMRP
jgi:hypothetical protein